MIPGACVGLPVGSDTQESGSAKAQKRDGQDVELRGRFLKVDRYYVAQAAITALAAEGEDDGKG